MTKEEIIKAYIDAGYALIPLKGKKPFTDNWPRTKVGDYDKESLAKGNYGVCLGPGDLVIDYDRRAAVPGDLPLGRLIRDIGGAIDTLIVVTGGGGCHIYLKKPADQAVRNSLEGYPGIEFKGGPGRQVVGPGSVHPDTGKKYVVSTGTPARVADAPKKLLKLIAKKEIDFSTAGTGEYKDDETTQQRFKNYLHGAAKPSIEGHRGDDNAFKVAAYGRDLGLPPERTLDFLLVEWNVRCVPPWEEDELRAKVAHAYRYARGAVGSAHPAAVFEKVKADPIAARTTSEAAGKAAWKLDNKKEPVKCFQNLLVHFNLPSSRLKGIFGFNEFSRRVEFINAAPWMNGNGPTRNKTQAVQDIDLSQIRAHLARNHGYETSKDDIVDAMVDISQAYKFHPVREYLSALAWDGAPRLDAWLIDYCGAKDDDKGYARAVGRKTLCAAVARIFKPGIKFDHVLVLEGEQGLGKSGICRILGGDWFADFKMSVEDKDTVQMMQGKWIVEMADLHVTRQADLDMVKSFLTRQVDEARFAYGRLPGQYPRQGIFIATYNPGPDGTYLKDDTGNRRWWPVRCEGVPPGARHFDFAGLARARDQIFAEALACWKAGEALTMDTPGLQDAARDAQAERHAGHPWTERIASWLAGQQQEFLTARDIFIHAMQGLDSRFSRRDQLDIARAMRELGWEPKNSLKDGHMLRGYVKKLKEGLDIFGDMV